MKFEIKSRWDDQVLFALDTDTLRLCLEAAVKAGAYLTGAYLADNVRLVGHRPSLQLGPIGSRADLLTAYITDAGVHVRTGCFFGTLDDFKVAVATTHGDGIHGIEYRAVIALIESHATLWTPAVTTEAA